MQVGEIGFTQLQIVLTVLLTSIVSTQSATIKDVFNVNPDGSLRVPRKTTFSYIGGSASQRDISTGRLKPEDLPEARDSQSSVAIEKRCSRCDTYTDYRGGSGAGGGSSYYRRDYRYQDPRYDNRRYYDDRYDSYDKYDSYDPYSYDSYYDRDRDRDRRPSYWSRDDYDRYEPRDRYNSRDRYYDRQSDRGVGYDNIGYDYKGYDSRYGYKPYDETYRGTSGFDSDGRGYYFNRGTPENASKWGTYASSWGYGRDDRDRDRGYRDYGSSRGQYRPRDYFSSGTSYLYGRPSSSTTTTNPSNAQDSDNSVTDAPNDTSSTDPIYFNIMSLPLKIIDKKSI